MQEDKFQGVGGLEIFFRSWRATRGKARGVVVIVHGFNAHGGLYLWTADQFAGQGLSVYALDQRGRGRSEGKRFHVNDVSEYVGDVATMVRLAKSREPGLPVFVLGHSAGGVISCTYALDHQDEIAGLVCEDFAFKVPAPDLALNVVKFLARILPDLPVSKLPNAGFSRDPRVVEKLESDPLIANEKQPAATIAALVRANERLRREFPKIRLPLLILHGAEDKVTLPEGSQFFYDTAGSSDKTLKIYPDAVHDLLSDLDRVQVHQDITAWITARI